MKTLDLIQGSPEWLAHRAQHFNASDAPAMLGVSPYKTRAQLLREMHTGVPADIDIATQKRFDNGHRAEALARPLAEQIIGADLYPVTGTKGRLSASFDGIRLEETEGFEHKALNAEIRDAFLKIESLPMVSGDEPCRLLPIYHRVQMEQQLHVSDAERILFMASEWDADGNLVEERHCWYYPDAELRAQILRGWDQFAADLAAYVPPEAAEPAAVGHAPETLPALRIEVTGAVTASNLAEFKQTALAAIRSVNRDLKTDQDFADADKAVKWCSDVEARLKAAKEHALSQTASIDELFKAIDDISAEARTVRLDLDKLVTRRKSEVKEQAVAKARADLDKHIAGLNAEIAPMMLRPVLVDWAGAIKGLKTLDSVRDRLGVALANGKIAADEQAKAVRANLATFKASADGSEFLFADLGALVHKAADDFKATVDARIAKHAADEAETKRKADEAKRLADEATAKAAATNTPEGRDSQQVLKAEPATADATDREKPAMRSPVGGPMGAGQAAAAAPAGEPATLRLGDVCSRLGFTLTAQFVTETLRVPCRVEGSAKLYRETDFTRICDALVLHVERVRAGVTA